jgi:hypothetical protein
VAEQEEQPEDEEEYNEMIMIRASDFVAFQDILEDMPSQIFREMHARKGSRPRTCSEPS